MDSLAREEVGSVRSRIHAEVVHSPAEAFSKSNSVILEIGPALRTSIHAPKESPVTVLMVEREAPAEKENVEVIFPTANHPGSDEKYKMLPASAESVLDFIQDHP